MRKYFISSLYCDAQNKTLLCVISQRFVDAYYKYGYNKIQKQNQCTDDDEEADIK